MLGFNPRWGWVRRKGCRAQLIVGGPHRNRSKGTASQCLLSPPAHLSQGVLSSLLTSLAAASSSSLPVLQSHIFIACFLGQERWYPI